MEQRDVIQFDNPYWSDKLKVSYLQRRIIVHSIIYYHLDTSVINDLKYDSLSNQLIRYTEQTCLEELKKTDYWYCMFDYDGATGFDLYNRLSDKDKNKLFEIAMLVIRSYQEYNKE